MIGAHRRGSGGIDEHDSSSTRRVMVLTIVTVPLVVDEGLDPTLGDTAPVGLGLRKATLYPECLLPDSFSGQFRGSVHIARGFRKHTYTQNLKPTLA